MHIRARRIMPGIAPWMDDPLGVIGPEMRDQKGTRAGQATKKAMP